MSGRKQHHIPQSLLRAWEIPSKGKKTQVWVFSKRNTFWGSTEGVAAERDFYSEPSADGTKTLDDLITDYEARFTKQITALRSLAIGATADPAVAAEVIAHLTIRNAHLRSSIAGGVRSLVEQAADLLFNEKNIRTIFGIDGKQFSPAMTARVDEEIGRDPRFAATGLPREVLHKIGFMAMKENFSHFVTDSLPSMQQALNLLANDAPTFMRKGQNKALFAGLAPDGRTAALAKLNWTVCNGTEGGVILPDCVALGVEGEGSPQPLIMSDLAKLDFVLMPLTPNTMLIGARSDGANPSLEGFNADAAACSHEFFVSARDGNDRDALVPLLGTRSKSTVDAAIQSAFEGFKKEHDITPLISYILPLVQASTENRQFDVMDLLRKECPLLDRSKMAPNAAVGKQLDELKKSLKELQDYFVAGSGKTFRDVLTLARSGNLLDLDERIAGHLETPPGTEPIDNDSKIMQAFFACLASELFAYKHYIDNLSPFATQQGIKGAEFERVLTVIDDEESTHSQFSYNKYFGITPLSANDQKNIDEGKETTVDRTRRLFYVCCSRAGRHLAVTLFVQDVEAAVAAITGRGLFQATQVLRLPELEAVG